MGNPFCNGMVKDLSLYGDAEWRNLSAEVMQMGYFNQGNALILTILYFYCDRFHKLL